MIPPPAGHLASAFQLRSIHAGAGRDSQRMAGGFDSAAIAGFCAAPGGDRAGDLRIAVRPDRHLAAIAGVDGVGVDDGLADYGGLGILLRPRAMEIAADQRPAAARIAGHIYFRAVCDRDGLAQHLHRAASPARRLPDASSVPLLMTSPSPASRMISPFSWRTEMASTMPLLLTTQSAILAAARAVISTLPPAARMTPELVTLADCGLPLASVVWRATGWVTA
jgi:hypothetical protein